MTVGLLQLAGASGYDDVNNFPYSNSRPQYNVSTQTLSWIGPTVSGGDSSNNAAGASTTSDATHSLVLSAPSSSGVTSSAAGQVFVGLNIIGADTCVTINHANCKILRSNLIGSGDSSGSFPGVVVLGNSSATGLLIEDCNISGADTTNQQASGVNTGASGPATPNLTVRRCTISQVEKGIGTNHMGNSYIDNYFWNFVGGDCDMVQVYESGTGGNNLGPTTVQHNTFDGRNNQYTTDNNSCINCSAWGMTDVAGNNIVSGITFTNNACGMPDANGHQVLFDMRPTQTSFGIIENMTVTDNAFFGAAAYFSSHSGNSEASGPAFTANSGNYIAASWPPQQGVGSLINGTGAV